MTKISSRSGFNLDPIIQRIAASKNPDQDGKITFSSMFRYYIITLYNALDFPPEIPEQEGRNIVRKALFEVGARGAIDTARVLQEIRNLSDNYLALPPKRFVLLTSVSIERNIALPSTRINGALITFDKRLSSTFVKEAQRFTSDSEKILFADAPTNYRPVKVHLLARSSEEAAEFGLKCLDIVRGIWNWYLNRKIFSRRNWGGAHAPINQLVLGPIHTLHESSGLIAGDTYWYEQSYKAPVKLKDMTEDLPQLTRFYKDVKAGLAKCQYRADLENALIRYTRALDERDWENAFLRLWGVLESLTNTSFDNNSKAIERTLFLLEDREYEYQVLNSLRMHRNQSVHADRKTDEIQTHLYQLKLYVEHLMRFHLWNNFNFSSIPEAADVLSLPVDKDKLIMGIRKAQYALKFRGFDSE